MKSTLLIIIFTLTIAAFGYYAYEFFKRKKKRVVAQDPQAQKDYKIVKQQKKEYKKTHLSLDEKVSKSWEFLTNITNQVLEKFSKVEQTKVHEASNKMIKHGMAYHHDIDHEIKQISGKVQSISKARSSSKEISR